MDKISKEKKLGERIHALISAKSAGNETAFAKKIGVPQNTLNRNLKKNNYKLLMGLVGWILLALPDVNPNWLLSGEGEMDNSASPPATTTSAAAVPPSEREAALERENSILRELADSKQSELAKAEKIIELYERGERGPQTTVGEDVALPVPTTLSAK